MGRRVLATALSFPSGPAPNASLGLHAWCDAYGNGGLVVAYVNSVSGAHAGGDAAAEARVPAPLRPSPPHALQTQRFPLRPTLAVVQ